MIRRDSKRDQKYFNICRLPRDIFYILWELLGIDMNNLILASSVIYRMCFRDMYWWHVRLDKDSVLFCSDELFRHKLLSRIGNPRRQLGLNLSGCWGVVDVSALGGVVWWM